MARRQQPATAPPRKPSDGGAVLLTGAGQIARVGPNGEQAGAALEVDEDLVVLLDSRALVDVGRRGVLDTSRDLIYAGKRPDGGPQRPLSRMRAAEPGRPPVRGVRTGLFADELRATPITGDAAAAESFIVPPPERIIFARAEAKRGIGYLGVGPAHAAAVDRAVGAALQAMIAGRKVEAEQGQPTAVEEAGP